jgi:DNA-binding beta-propeller fold protein YncE
MDALSRSIVPVVLAAVAVSLGPAAGTTHALVPYAGVILQHPGATLAHTHGGKLYPRLFCARKVAYSPWNYCTGTLTLRSGRRVVAKVPIAVHSYDGPTVAVPLPGWFRRKVARAPQRVRVTIWTHDGQGLTHIYRNTLRIKAPGKGEEAGPAPTIGFGVAPAPDPTNGAVADEPVSPIGILQSLLAPWLKNWWGNPLGSLQEGSDRPGLFGTGRQSAGGDRQYDNPAGMALDRDGNLLVADTSNNRIQRFTPDGTFLNSFGSRGVDPGDPRKVGARGQLLNPVSIAVDPAGFIYVSDNRNSRITKWTHDGRWVQRIGYRGSGKGQFVGNWGITVLRGVLYAIDIGNYRVNKFTLSGRPLGSFGHFGLGEGGFVTPLGIVGDPATGDLFVTDANRHKVLRFSPSGRFAGEWGTEGARAGELWMPQGIAIDARGNLLVADYLQKRVSRFTREGRFVDAFGGNVPWLPLLSQLDAPSAVAADSRGNVFVADAGNVRRGGERCGRYKIPEPDPCRPRRVMHYVVR